MVAQHPAKVPIVQTVSAFESRCLRQICVSDVIGSHAGPRSLRHKVYMVKAYIVCHIHKI